MKKTVYLVAFFALFLGFASCKKDSHEPTTPEQPTPEIPDAFVGKWISGNFNPAHYADYDGTREADMQNTVAYDFKKNGTAEQFIYYYYDDGSEKQVLTYRKGTVTFDADSKTLQFKPMQGTSRTFENGTDREDNMSNGGLYPKYAPKYRNCTLEEQDNVLYFVGTNDQNERVGYAQVNW